jgi:hypothetical protein
VIRTVLAAVALLAIASGARAQSIPLPEDLPRTELKALCRASYEPMTGQYGDGAHGPPILWRCSHGQAYACMAGADGVACSARSRSRDPLPMMIAACRDYGQLSVASGALRTVWDWECRGGKPVNMGPAAALNINSGAKTPVKFDEQGYSISEWIKL